MCIWIVQQDTSAWFFWGVSHVIALAIPHLITFSSVLLWLCITSIICNPPQNPALRKRRISY